MWVLVINGLLYLIHGLASRHFQRDLLPVTACSVGRDLRAALRFELKHEHGVYNALQRLMYWLVLAAGVLIAASGLAIWKPVQLQMLVALLGGYDTARYVHFGHRCVCRCARCDGVVGPENLSADDHWWQA